MLAGLKGKDGLFQFTHPGRGATDDYLIFELPKIGFNSRTPGGVRQKP